LIDPEGHANPLGHQPEKPLIVLRLDVPPMLLARADEVIE
jgi:hypothetical protein